MDWGLGNPNKTAALIAILMVAVWSLSYLKKWMFWVSLALFSALGICLVHTFSRGGIVAAFCGLIPLLVCARWPWPTKRIVGVVLSVWLVIAASIYLQAHERFGQGVATEDRSISNRFVLWKAAPTMMADAAGGWGIGQAGKAYMDWYQPLDRSESYRTLVNSHLTWLVEFGLFGRFFYILGWLAAFLLCLPVAGNRWLAVPLGIDIAFFTGAFFSSVAESGWLWVVPGIALAWVIVWRLRNHAWPSTGLFLVPPVGAAFLLICLAGLSPHARFSKRGTVLVIGKGEPATWIVADRKVLGSSFPRSLRGASAKNPALSCAVVEKLADLPENAESLVVSGKLPGDTPYRLGKIMQSVKSVALVNPAFLPAELPIPKGTAVRIAIGEFAQSASAADWASVGKVEQLVGVGDFVPNWPAVVFPLK